MPQLRPSARIVPERRPDGRKEGTLLATTLVQRKKVSARNNSVCPVSGPERCPDCTGFLAWPEIGWVRVQSIVSGLDSREYAEPRENSISRFCIFGIMQNRDIHNREIHLAVMDLAILIPTLGNNDLCRNFDCLRTWSAKEDPTRNTKKGLCLKQLLFKGENKGRDSWSREKITQRNVLTLGTCDQQSQTFRVQRNILVRSLPLLATTAKATLGRISYNPGLGNKIPYVLFWKRPVSLAHLKIPGSLAYVHVAKPSRRDKLESSAWKGVMVEYAMGIRGFRIWDPILSDVYESKQVKFDETRLYKDVCTRDTDDEDTTPPRPRLTPTRPPPPIPAPATQKISLPTIPPFVSTRKKGGPVSTTSVKPTRVAYRAPVPNKPGWEREEVQRQSGATKGQWNVYYYAPGLRTVLRSRPDVKAYCETNLKVKYKADDLGGLRVAKEKIVGSLAQFELVQVDGKGLLHNRYLKEIFLRKQEIESNEKMANTGTSTPEIEENTQPGSGRDSAGVSFHDQLEEGFWNVQIDSVKKAILEAEASVSLLELKMNKRIAQVLLEGLMNIWENRRVTTFEEQEKERVEIELKIAKAKSDAKGVPGTSFPLGKKTNAYLPKLPLATFKEKLLQWPSFIDLFESSIDKNPNLSLVEKMQYLKAACMGPAARLIEWFPIEEKNYQIALDALKEHFGSPEMIESALVKVIKGLSPLKSIKPVLAVKECLALMSGYARRLG
uniref:MBD domain-containing protein n=1 Tax=Strigamia maritima TaxID=126957 RepID=T1IHK9_STRMM